MRSTVAHIKAVIALVSAFALFGKEVRHKQTAMAAALGIVALVYNSYFGYSPDGPLVQTTYGVLRGSALEKSREGRNYHQFLGIPYARPPVGDLRFEPPLAPVNWKGIRNAKQYGPECMQLEVMVTGRQTGSEDCLYLNIMTPQIVKGENLLPVMVWIHGGLFMAGGSNMYKGKYFMDENVVLVTLNYRLAALGFLNTGDDVVRGNMGLKDQVMALRYIKANIQAFGGDPERVTIFGESAGGSSVHLHLLSPLSKGLFQKALSQSGTAIKIWALNKTPKEQAINLGNKVGCPTQNSTILVRCLKNKDVKELIRVSIASMSPIRSNLDLYVPTVETILQDDTFLPDDPLNLLRNGSFSYIPWMIGVNTGEGLLNTGRILANSKISEQLSANWNQWIPRMLNYDESRLDISKKVRQYYFGRSMKTNPLDNIRNLTQMYSDRVYFHSTHNAALIHAQHAPVFMYYYSYSGDMSFFRLFKAVMPNEDDFIPPELKIAADLTKDFIKKYIMRSELPYYGPCHADELFMLFNMHMVTEVRKMSTDFAFSRDVVKSWVSFATNESNLQYQSQLWPAVNPNGHLKYMNIDKEGHLIDEPFQRSIEFWDSLGV